MQNIILTTRLATFGCLSIMLAGYSLSVSNNIHKKFSLKDILLNSNFKTDPFVDYHDFFPTEEDIANNIVNNDLLDDITHQQDTYKMVEAADHYEELFDAPNFVTINPAPPILAFSYSEDAPDVIENSDKKPEKQAEIYKRPDFTVRTGENSVILSLRPRPALHQDIAAEDTKNRQILTLPKPASAQKKLQAVEAEDKKKKSKLSAIEQAIQDLSRQNTLYDPFEPKSSHRQTIKKTIKTPAQKKNTVKTNYLSLYKPKTDLDESFILPLSDALRLSKAEQTEKRDNFKKDIADIYDKRRVQTLKARNHNKSLAGHIAEINKILKQMGISLDKKFYAHKHDLSKHTILKDMFVSKEDLVFRFPNLYSSLQKAQALKIAMSFIPSASPVRTGRMSSNYGWRKDPIHKKSRFHSGIDFAASSGTPIYSPASGTVKFAGWKGGYGKTIEIYHGNGITTRYAHLSRINVKKGQKIIQFSKIGAVGSTGRSTGPHLHYEIMKGTKKVNPKVFTNKNKKIVNILKNIK